jgi:hypothetical protein
MRNVGQRLTPPSAHGLRPMVDRSRTGQLPVNSGRRRYLDHGSADELETYTVVLCSLKDAVLQLGRVSEDCEAGLTVPVNSRSATGQSVGRRCRGQYWLQSYQTRADASMRSVVHDVSFGRGSERSLSTSPARSSPGKRRATAGRPSDGDHGINRPWIVAHLPHIAPSIVGFPACHLGCDRPWSLLTPPPGRLWAGPGQPPVKTRGWEPKLHTGSLTVRMDRT